MLHLSTQRTQAIFIPYDYEEIAISDDNIKQLNSTKVAVSVAAEVRCEGIPGRYTVHGGDPSAAVGLPAFDGQEIPLVGNAAMSQFKYIRQSSGSGKLDVVYYKFG